MNIHQGLLDTISGYLQSLVRQHNLPTKIVATTDRREALGGANYVVVIIQVGGLAMYEQDVIIPRRYGLDQTVGDTLGPGGVFRGPRTIPVLLDLCHDMEELCPKALLINYSNPMAINCLAMERATKIKSLGLCHSVQGTAERLSRSAVCEQTAERESPTTSFPTTGKRRVSRRLRASTTRPGSCAWTGRERTPTRSSGRRWMTRRFTPKTRCASRSCATFAPSSPSRATTCRSMSPGFARTPRW